MTAAFNKPTGGQILAAALMQHQVDTVFAIPGIQLDWAMEALREQQDHIRLLVPRHEQTTTYMADGYYRASGKPGVAMVVPGPGVLNAGAGMATAYAANSRVMLIAGDVFSASQGAGLGLLHEIHNQSGVLASLTRYSQRVGHVSEMRPAVDMAFAKMLSGRPGPVALEVPHDVLESRMAWQPPATAITSAPPLAPEQKMLERIAQEIDQASFPIIYVGGGIVASGATQALQGLADKLQIPVIMSDNGLGALSSRHPMAMNTIAGRALFQKADVAIIIGSRFIDSLYPRPAWDDSGKRFIHINIDANDISPPRAAYLAMQADARLALEGLYSLVRKRTVLEAAMAQRLKAWAQAQIDEVSPQADYIRVMRAALPEDGIFVNELTQVGYLARSAFPVYAPGTYIGPTYQGTLGYGFPAALGAAAAGTASRVLCITGDGGFGWNLQELATARKYNLPVTLVIFNDGHFGNVRAIQHRVFGASKEVAVDLENPDFLALAAAFRVPAKRVNNPAELQAAIAESLSESGPVLIEAPVGDMPSPWPLFGLQPPPDVPMPQGAGPSPLL